MDIDVNDRKKLLQFFKEIDVKYLNKNLIKNRPLLLGSSYFQKNKLEFGELDLKYRSAIEKNLKPELIIKESLIDGLGLWTKNSLQAGDFVGQYTGIQKFINPFSQNTDYSFIIPAPTFPRLEINSSKCGNELRFVNHSWKANLQCDHMVYKNSWIIIFFAKEFIKAGNELTVNYGDDYFVTKKREVEIDADSFTKLTKMAKSYKNRLLY